MKLINCEKCGHILSGDKGCEYCLLEKIDIALSEKEIPEHDCPIEAGHGEDGCEICGEYLNDKV